MRNEKNPESKKLTKPVAVFLAVTLLVITAVGGTLAWFTSAPPVVTNTFTIGNIEIALTETTGTLDGSNRAFKMVPGYVIDKDPVVTVKGGSEDCWVFIKVEENCTAEKADGSKYSFDEFLKYNIDVKDAAGNGNFEELEPGVYYCKVLDVTADRSIKILGGGNYTYDGHNYTWNSQQVLTKPEVTEAMMEAVETDGEPTLTFTAYAVQYWKNNTEYFAPAEAWRIANTGTVTP